uniref:Feline leukemia virus subgroup C cellular receptor 1 n=1 Tax=Eptatretus burgeri TaxID=7764 RepID=A0A8C4PYT3_EPTBU
KQTENDTNLENSDTPLPLSKCFLMTWQHLIGCKVKSRARASSLHRDVRDREADGPRASKLLPRLTAMEKNVMSGHESGGTRLYPLRWVIVALFSCYSLSNAFQWIEYGIINNIFSRYYNVSSTDVDWLSISYMVVYIPLIFPATWLLDMQGLRVVALLGAALNCAGAWVKTGSAQPHLFPVTVVGQVMCACAQSLILGLPSHIASVWFGPREVSTACALGVFGNQVSSLVFHEFPLVLSKCHMISFIFFYFINFLTLPPPHSPPVVFKEQPPIPPSHAQAAIRSNTHKDYSYKKSILRLFNNKAFLNVLISYKCVTFLLVYFLTFVSMVVFTFTLSLGHIWVVFVTGGVLGFTMTGYLPVGFEYAVELTYPESEGTSSGLLNASAQVCSIAITHLNNIRETLVLCIRVGSVLAFAKPRFIRQTARW